jgi:hypothetical protein
MCFEVFVFLLNAHNMRFEEIGKRQEKEGGGTHSSKTVVLRDSS